MKKYYSETLLLTIAALCIQKFLPIVNAFSISIITSSPLKSSSFHGDKWSSSSFSSLGRQRSSTSSSSSSLNMMFDELSRAITRAAQNQFGLQKRMTEANIRPALRDVRRALLDADVNLGVADALIEGVRRRSLGTQVLEGVTAEQQFVKVMYDELLDMMGGDSSSSSSSQSKPTEGIKLGAIGNPSVILLAGLQGAGKTTAAGKLALFLQEREIDYVKVANIPPQEAAQMLSSRLPKTNRKVLLVAADVYRPAAIQQLQILGESVGVTVYSEGKDADPVEIAKNAVAKAKVEGYDTVLIDTAGRQVIDVDLMAELQRIKDAVNPDDTLLVVDAMTGQEAASLTASFDSAVGITGAILTKLDGDSRGGAAVSVRGVSGKPIKFVGTGEKIADMEPFYPDRMASRILGMGDVVSLVEKAAAEVSDADAMKMTKKMLDAQFDFDDFLKQSQLVAKMGSLAGVAKMLPGMGNAIDTSRIKEVEARIKSSEAMIQSMNKKERANPELLIKDKTARSRLMRITKGAGLKFEEGLQFVGEFQKMRTMMSRMQKQMGVGGMFPGDPAFASPAALGEASAAAGNRQARRSSKKKVKSGRGGGGGFGR